MDIIVKAKVDFSVAERSGSRTVSREFSIEGDNQVPIMIVNEEDRRIKRIPLVDGSQIRNNWGSQLGVRPVQTVEKCSFLFSKLTLKINSMVRPTYVS
ncbi:MAG: hypothetical protein M0R46_14655 [Candidatus Muirbacterium halophilum]|nr:hypothetical protein [Candidatus Muirbacterium halophilum]